MFKTVLCSTLAIVGGTAIVCFADAKEDAAAAAQKLGDAQNYSWKQTVENGGGGGGGRGGAFGNFEGKTEKGGVTAITREVQGEARTTYTKGDKTVMQNQDGEWMTMEEMMAARGGGNGGNANGGGRRRGRGGAPQAPQRPAEAIQDIVSKATNLTSSDGAISGMLSEDAIKAMLTAGGRGGRRGGGGNATPPEISNAKGTVKIWTKDGVISKYETHVTGTISFNGNDRDVDRTTTVEVSNVGSTKVEVPEAAAKKLG